MNLSQNAYQNKQESKTLCEFLFYFIALFAFFKLQKQQFWSPNYSWFLDFPIGFLQIP